MHICVCGIGRVNPLTALRASLALKLWDFATVVAKTAAPCLYATAILRALLGAPQDRRSDRRTGT